MAEAVGESIPEGGTNMVAIPRPALRLDGLPGVRGPWSVSVHGLAPEQAAALKQGTGAGEKFRRILRVSVVLAGMPSGEDDLPDVLGQYQVSADGLRFVPRFPFVPGVKYRARFDPRPLGGSPPAETLTTEFELPGGSGGEPAAVERVFPSADTLPENLLRFYVHFSKPMRRGRAQEQIAVLGPDGRPMPDVLYRAPLELWDRGMRCLTVLLDPGRLKRDVGPHAELGPPLKAGREYTLAVGAGILDGSGRPLRAGFAKRFRVAGAIREPVAVERWQLAWPAVGSRQPLGITFPRPLDSAMLRWAIVIEASGGRLVEGEIGLGGDETRWNLTPARPWAAGSYRVRIAANLEDVCGNSAVAAFDRPLRAAIDSARETADRLLDFCLA